MSGDDELINERANDKSARSPSWSDRARVSGKAPKRSRTPRRIQSRQTNAFDERNAARRENGGCARRTCAPLMPTRDTSSSPRACLIIWWGGGRGGHDYKLLTKMLVQHFHVCFCFLLFQRHQFLFPETLMFLFYCNYSYYFCTKYHFLPVIFKQYTPPPALSCKYDTMEIIACPIFRCPRDTYVAVSGRPMQRLPTPSFHRASKYLSH